MFLAVVCLIVGTTTGRAAAVAFFSTEATAQLSVSASTTDMEITSDNATVTGGTMYVTNGQSTAKDLISSNSSAVRFTFTNNNTFFKVVLDEALREGDVVRVNLLGGTKDGAWKGIWLSTQSSRPNTAPDSITTTNTSYTDLTYTISAGDELVGATTFYIYRSAGATTYLTSMSITREVDVAPIITTDLSSTAFVGIGSANTFSIVATDATSYQWYKATSATANVGSDTSIEGATSASYSYTASAEGTEYIYCVASNAYGSTVSTVCAVTASEFIPVTFGLTRPLTAPATEGGKGTMGANVWNTANDLIALSEIHGSDISIDGQSRDYVIGGVTYSSNYNYKKSTNTSTFAETHYMGYSFVVPDAKKLNVTQVNARLSDASNATWTWKISVQNSEGTVLWESGNRTTSGNSTTTATISDNALATALEGLSSGTYFAKIYYYQGGTTKCATIDLTFTGNLSDADPEVANVTIPETASAILNESNTITSTVNAYPAVTAYQWYSCDANGENATEVEGATTSTLTFTPSTEGTIYYYLAATNEAGTANSNVCAVTVVAEALFSDFSAILNNQTGSLLTSAEQVQNTAVNFGIAVDGEGNTIRVATDSPLAFATVSGAYHSDHGMTGLSVTTKVSGNVKISVGECTYSGNVITVKNADNQTVASTTPVMDCWKNNHSNVAVLYYEGGATTLTISGMAYCPYIAVEAVETVPALYTIKYYNGSELVKTSEVYEGTTLGSLPANQTAPEGQYFIGWYTATDGTGTPATVGTIPTGDTNYYANFVTLTQSNGYVIVDNSRTDRKNGENLLGALAYANANSSANNPVKIFLPNGTYDLGDAAETTKLTGSYISLIGESLEGTIIRNTPVQEGLGTATLLYNKGEYNYLQDITLHNNYPYGNSTGRAASLKDEGNYTICKNVWLYSHQDTYYSHRDHSKFYFNGGKISGCVDYMCGQSCVYFDGVTLSNDNRDTYMTANSELYVFNNCVVENGGSTYKYGRAWSTTANFGDPVCVFLNTTLKDNGSNMASSRWMLSGLNTDYAVAGEYGTKNAEGTDITPASNNVTFTKKNTTLNTILTAEQAAVYTIEYTLGDEWAATAVADATQAEVSNVVLNGNTLTWEGSSDAYLIEKNGEFVALTSETSYTVENGETYTVRAANGRGGFGEAVESIEATLTLTTTQNMAGYKSFYSADKSYTLDENTTAYVAIQKKDNLISLRKIAVVPANTPVILKTTGVAAEPTSAAYYQMTLTASDDELAVNTDDNLLAVTAGAGENLNVYRLGYKAGEDYGVGFYTWTVTGNTTAGIVYININNDGGNSAKLGFIFEDEEEETPTAINSISEDNTETEDAAYNMAGQRINPTAKGLVIKRNGKFINQ